ncbi:MAG: hypothetical protein EXR79_17220, partial [Myxococcales bacterium]|nr:hypothetical protein [Myxococcales bacterium]
TARLVDQLLADLLAAYTRKGLLDQTDVLVVSDHGFEATSRYADPAAALRACGLSGATTGVAINGHGLFLYLPTALARDPSAVAAACAKHPDVARALPATDSQLFGPAPSGGADARVPDLVLVAKPEFVWSASRVRKGPPLTRGMHGGLANDPDLQAVWVAAGPHVAARAEPERRQMLDVAALLCGWLGVQGCGSR